MAGEQGLIREAQDGATQDVSQGSRIDAVVSRLAALFVDTPPERFDDAVREALRTIAESEGFDRVLLMQVDAARENLTVTHEWAAGESTPFAPWLGSISIEKSGWPFPETLAGRTTIATRDQLPEHATGRGRVMALAKIQRFAMVPLTIAGAVEGLVSFHQLRTPASVSADCREYLELVARLVAGAIARKRAEDERRRLAGELERVRAPAEGEREEPREQARADRADRSLGEIIGDSPALRRALSAATAVAGTDASVLVQGETGVGKELFAQAIHARSARAERALVKVNCASIPRELFESEFFGHVRGAFSGAVRDRVGRFELAHGGTLFLDEVGEIPPELQSKLLRVLQEGEFERVGDDRTRSTDVRLVAATNRDLRAEVRAGRFREDLYYRLSAFPIVVPPLRARREDLLPLAEHFLRVRARELGRTGLALSPSDRRVLLAYDWPGNIRELAHVIERAVILSPAPPLRLDLALPDAEPGVRTPPHYAVLSDAELRELERRNLAAALERASGRVSGRGGAAELLGVRPSTLRDRMKALGLGRRGA